MNQKEWEVHTISSGYPPCKSVRYTDLLGVWLRYQNELEIASENQTPKIDEIVIWEFDEDSSRIVSLNEVGSDQFRKELGIRE